MQKKRLHILSILLIIFLRWISEVGFAIQYSTAKDSYLWLKSGDRVYKLAPKWGYFEQQIDNFTNSKPLPYQTSIIGKYQAQCPYGIGNCSAFLWQDALSAFYRIDSIQYIAKDVDIRSPSDLTNRLALLHDSSPQRYYPYILTQYIWPTTKSSFETEPVEARLTRDNTILLWEKGIDSLCDKNRIEWINSLEYSNFIKELQNPESKYRYPCPLWWELAHTLAFNYFYYDGNPEKAILYYKVASFHDDIPAITSSMPAIIEWNEGNHKISAYLRYDQFSNSIHNYSNNKENLREDELNSLERTMKKSLEKTGEEFNLYLLDEASALALEDNNNDCATSKNCLEQQSYLQNTIRRIEDNCTLDPIACEILAIGKENDRISSSTIYPTHPDKSYIWNTETGERDIKYD